MSSIETTFSRDSLPKGSLLAPTNTLLLRNNRFFYEEIEKTTIKLQLIQIKSLPLHHVIYILKMESKDLNRIKVMLAEKKRTNKWLAEQLGKDPATVSKWVTNVSQPNIETLIQISKCLGVGGEALFRTDQ